MLTLFYTVQFSRYSGGDERDRTADPLRARQVLSQLSYIPFPSRSKGSKSEFRLLKEMAWAISLWSNFELLTPNFVNVVGLGGVEPPTSRLSGVRSSRLSYRPVSRG
jgi:hypothetical protein